MCDSVESYSMSLLCDKTITILTRKTKPILKTVVYSPGSLKNEAKKCSILANPQLRQRIV